MFKTDQNKIKKQKIHSQYTFLVVVVIVVAFVLFNFIDFMLREGGNVINVIF